MNVSILIYPLLILIVGCYFIYRHMRLKKKNDKLSRSATPIFLILGLNAICISVFMILNTLGLVK
jgi:hypothetical protein